MPIIKFKFNWTATGILDKLQLEIAFAIKDQKPLSKCTLLKLILEFDHDGSPIIFSTFFASVSRL